MRELDADTSLESIAIISDIHSNSNSLSESLDIIRTMNIPKVIILGDLLSYGCDPNGVIEQLISLQNDRECIFVKGNHDQFYFDIKNNKDPFKYEIPQFISESVHWNYNECKYDLETEFDWVENYQIGNCLFSHANPFIYGDWTYMNNESDHYLAAKVLEKESFKIAFFGHTHRQKLGKCKNIEDNEIQIDSTTKSHTINLKSKNINIFNTGSIGQPRGNLTSFITVMLNSEKAKVTIHELTLDHSPHILQIEKSNMKIKTKEKLISFFIEGMA
jgi:predicted phosphodiesterase